MTLDTNSPCTIAAIIVSLSSGIVTKNCTQNYPVDLRLVESGGSKGWGSNDCLI